jgi:hypothetical protein
MPFGVVKSCLRTNKGFSQKVDRHLFFMGRIDWKSDAIGRGRIVKKIIMDMGNLLFGDKMKDHFLSRNFKFFKQKRDRLSHLGQGDGKVSLRIIKSDFQNLNGYRGFGKACHFGVFSIFPSAEASKDIYAFEALKNIALFGRFTRFSIAAVSSHGGNPYKFLFDFWNKRKLGEIACEGIGMFFKAFRENIFDRSCFLCWGGWTPTGNSASFCLFADANHRKTPKNSQFTTNYNG